MPNTWQPGQLLGGLIGSFQRPQRQGTTSSKPQGQQDLERMGYGEQAAGRAGYMAPRGYNAAGYGAAAGRAANVLVGEGFRLQEEEQQGLDWAKQRLQEMWPEITQHPLTERDINLMASGQLASIERDKMATLQSVREWTGGSDLEGGMGADLVLQAELGALGQAGQMRAGLQERHAAMTADHQMKLLSAVGVGQNIMAAQSTYGAEAAAQAAGFYTSMQGAEREAEAAAAAAKSQKESSMIGGVIGLAGSLLGGLF